MRSRLLVMTDASLASHAGAGAPDSVFDVRRFRPNILIRARPPIPTSRFPEVWLGRTVVYAIGEVADTHDRSLSARAVS